MAQFFLGADIGGTKTHAVVADARGRAVGFGESGPGNHESVGYDGLLRVVQAACGQAIRSAGIPLEDISGAGFGIAGYDWPTQKEDHLRTLGGSACGSAAIVNDAILGLVAGSTESWGVAIVAGTGCNCRGWNQERTREGRVTGFGILMGEGAGSSELMFRAVQAVSYEWTRRGPVTALSQAFITYTGAASLDDLIEGFTSRRYKLDAAAAPLVFRTAHEGDPVARALVRWAGTELGEMANAVARQLDFGGQSYDVVMIGSMFQNGEILISSLRETVHAFAPEACLVSLTEPPAVGGVLLGMEAAGFRPDAEIRLQLLESVSAMRNGAGK
jgi:N-acetylglucosamine kinase-like BadF-type ATPase